MYALLLCTTRAQVWKDVLARVVAERGHCDDDRGDDRRAHAVEGEVNHAAQAGVPERDEVHARVPAEPRRRLLESHPVHRVAPAAPPLPRRGRAATLRARRIIRLDGREWRTATPLAYVKHDVATVRSKPTRGCRPWRRSDE